MLGAITITHRRLSGGALDSATGLYGTQTTTDTTIRGSVQPAPGTSTSEDSGGTRTADRIVLYIPGGTLRAEDQYTGGRADRVQVDGAWYEVQAVSSHAPSHRRLTHQRVEAMRLAEASDD